MDILLTNLVSTIRRRNKLLHPEIRDATISSSMFKMIRRCYKIREFHINLDDLYIDAYLLNVAVERWVDKSVRHSAELDAATKKRQRENATSGGA